MLPDASEEVPEHPLIDMKIKSKRSKNMALKIFF
jgi:hypothetical protein